MFDTFLVEDSTIDKLSPTLERILRYLDENATHHDYFVALLIAFLAECHFHVSSTSTDSECPKLQSICIPKDWKSKETGVYTINFQLETVPDVECKLIAIPSGDTILVNFYSVAKNRTAYSIAVQTLKYVNPFSSDLSGRYINLKEISHRFKNMVATPVRSEILTKAGLTSPSLQGLPDELKFMIFGMLDVHGLTSIAQCCSEFRELCSDQQLWKHLLQKDFPRKVREVEDYKALYSRVYSRKNNIRRHV